MPAQNVDERTIEILASIFSAVQGVWAHSQYIVREGGVFPSESYAAAPGMLPLRFVGEVCWARFAPPLKRGRCLSIVHIPVRWVCGL